MMLYISYIGLPFGPKKLKFSTRRREALIIYNKRKYTLSFSHLHLVGFISVIVLKDGDKVKVSRYHCLSSIAHVGKGVPEEGTYKTHIKHQVSSGAWVLAYTRGYPSYDCGIVKIPSKRSFTGFGTIVGSVILFEYSNVASHLLFYVFDVGSFFALAFFSFW